MSVVTDILQGKHDDELNEIYNAYRERSKAVSRIKAQTAMVEFRIGDKVRFAANTKPARLRGCVGTVTKKNPTRISIVMDANEWESYNVPPALLEKVEA